jgi:hypothetical protein
MDDDNLIIKAVAAFAICLVLSVSGCVGYTNTLIANSPDPLAAACAMGTSDKACVAVGRH